MSSITNFLRGKSLFITGATGFLAKGLVEKILRHVPDVERMYLLIRPKRLPDGSTLSAEERLEREVFLSNAFATLRDLYGERFQEVLRQKMVAVAGDLTFDHLGMSADVYTSLTQEIQVVINSAASVTFDERIDHALQLNTLGARHVVEFARACRNAILVHVSTAYVSGQRTGRIPEEPLAPDRSVAQEIGRPAKPYDLEREIRSALAFAKRVHEDSRTPEQFAEFRRAALKQNEQPPTARWLDAQVETIRKRWVKRRLVDEGMRRAKQLGWHDSYTLTKAMGEQLIVKTRGDLPTAIVRPSIIESSLVEPEPGWVDGLKVADPLIDAFSRGRLPDFPSNPSVIIDIVPVDIVVNVILAVMPRLAQDGGLTVYQAATGSQNPLTCRVLFDLIHDYFREHPRLNKQGEPIPVNDWSWNFPTFARFRRRQQLKYLAPLNAIQWVAERCSGLATMARVKQRVTVLKATVNRLLYYAEIYSPYTTLDYQFETSRTQRLYEEMEPEDRRLFNFDVTRIRWKEYIQDIHIPGLKRHVLKTEAPEAPEPDESADGESADRAGLDQEREENPLETLGDLLAKSAAKYPDKVALRVRRNGEWVQYTYQEVYDRAGRIGAFWGQHGLRPGDRVLLYAENGPAWGIVYFAAIAAGATVVPIDRQTPESEIWAIARFTDARALLCSDLCFVNLSEEALLANAESESGLHIWNIDNHGRPFGEPTSDDPPALLGDDPPAWEPLHPDALASIIFTKGTAVDPRGVMLSHRNFITDLIALADVLRAYETDRFLSILPLNHALEFTGGFLMPLYGGATITYVETLKSRVVLDLMEETKTTCLLAVPRIFKLLYDRIQRDVEIGNGGAEDTATPGGVRPDASAFGGHLRLLVSGGAALGAELYDAYQRIGLTIYEGYGLTETAPILTVNPMGNSKRNSVGPPLPGIELRIDNPDADGNGEVVVRGPNVMAGYYRNPHATADVLRDGWLYTGDIGRLDEDGYLSITGRSKDLIVTGAGKNVYPDEVEQFYRSIPYIKHLKVVGVRAPHTLSEDIHAVVVPDWEAFPGPRDPDALRRSLMEAVHTVSKRLPTYQRIQQVHLWEEPLPCEGDMKRAREHLQRALAERLQAAQEGKASQTAEQAGLPWEQAVYRVVSQLTGLPVPEVASQPDRPLDEMMDSLMRVELLAALETRFETSISDAAALQIQTIQDVLNAVKDHLERNNAGWIEESSRPIDTTPFWARMLAASASKNGSPDLSRRTIGQDLTRHGFWLWGRFLYRWYFRLTCQGLEHLPADVPYIVAANHCSHLDSGAIIISLWGRVDRLHVLGAKDYFFNTPTKAWFFSTFLNVIPFDRHGDFFEGLRSSSRVLAPKRPILIYPEGTRSVSGELQPFKVGLGLLALELNVPVVPAYIRGTYDALPKGRSFPKPGAIQVIFGPPLSMTPYRAKKGTRMNYDLYRDIVQQVRLAIERLRERVVTSDK
ncbi:MAG: AMP-binding protein [Candidatus Latescibacteria bacterium]|nr:AMP-binding protein [Candidatus Latescibacterota bacterium]